MKQLFFTIAILLGLLQTINAQEGFSAQAGLSAVTLSVDFAGQSESDTEIGFFAGVGYQFSIDDKFDLQPSLLFSVVDDLNSLYVPVMVKYNLTDQFNIQAGPQVNYLLEDAFDSGQFGIDIAAGVGYRITDEIYVQGRYGLEIVRDLDNVNVNTFQIGVGYNF